MGVCRQQGRRKNETQPQPSRSRSNCPIFANTLLAYQHTVRVLLLAKRRQQQARSLFHAIRSH